jgi:hypothetical protein
MEYTEAITAVAISVIFSLVKIVEYKLIIKEEIVFNTILRDIFLVGVSAFIGQFLMTQVDLTSVTKTATNAFVGIPDF